jgi:hypothetical protein
MSLFTKKCSPEIEFELMTKEELLELRDKVRRERDFLTFLSIVVLFLGLTIIGFDHDKAMLVILSASYIAIFGESDRKLKKIKKELGKR